MKMKRVLLLALLLLGDVNSPSSSSSITAVASNNYRDGGCNACRMHEEIRALSLEAIKEQILNRLGLKQAPNMTGRALPRIPPISKLLDMYGMQADQPQSVEPGITYHEQMDEYSAKTESVFALAHPRKSNMITYSINVILHIYNLQKKPHYKFIYNKTKI